MALEALQRFGWIAIITLIATTVVILTCIGWFMFLWWSSINNNFWHMIIINGWAPRAVALAGSVLHLMVAAQTGVCISMLAGIAMETCSVPFEQLASISLLRSYAPAPFDALIGLLYPLSMNKATRTSRHNLFVIAPLTVLLLITTTFLLFGSTILLTDVIIQLVPGMMNGEPINSTIDFSLYDTQEYIEGLEDLQGPKWNFLYRSPVVRNFAWLSEPPGIFPAFAEHAEPLYTSLPPEVSDTGPVVRAFLPYAASEKRSLLRSYKGKALVFDARVSCQPANLYDIDFVDATEEDLANQGDPAYGYSDMDDRYLAVVAKMSYPSLHDPLMRPPFNTKGKGYLPILLRYISGVQILQLNNNAADEEGDITDDYSGGFDSAFSDLRGKNKTGSVYLIYNNTKIGIPGFPQLIGEDEPKKVEIPAPSPDWASYAFRSFPKYTPRYPEDWAPRLIHMSVCYTSSDLAVREVFIHNTKAAREPIILPQNTTTVTFDFRQAADQLVGKVTRPESGEPQRSTSAGREARGVFHLEKPENGWHVLPPSPDNQRNGLSVDGPWWWCNISKPDPGRMHECSPKQHYITKSLSLFRDPKDRRNTHTDNNDGNQRNVLGNFTIVFDPAAEHDSRYSARGSEWIKDLFNDVYDRTRQDTSGRGGVAAAFQSVLWTLAVTSYTSRISEFDRTEQAQSVFYVNVSSPGGPFGSSRLDTAYATRLSNGVAPSKIPLGLSLVLGMTLLHLLIVSMIALAFQRLTKLTKLNDPWQAVANVMAAGESLNISEYINNAAVRRGAVAKKIEVSEYGDKAVGVSERAGKIVLETRGGRIVRANGDEEHQSVPMGRGKKGQWKKVPQDDSSASSSM